MKDLFKIIKYIINHPIGKKNKYQTLLRFFKWQFFSLIYNYQIIFSYINNSKLIVKKSLHSATANMYVGLQEFDEMGFTLHLLNKKDVFFDIGANIGIYTILASKIRRAKTYAFEPVKQTSFYLKNNVSLNQIDNLVEIHNIALGDKKEIVNFTTGLDSENHVLNKANETSYTVEIERLDDLIKKIPILIKIDVEGFEFHVLKGGENIISNENLKAIIIEMNSSSNRYDIDETEIHEFLRTKGFNIYNYYPFKRELKKVESFSNGNNIYIRDIDFVEQRIINAPTINIYNTEI